MNLVSTETAVTGPVYIQYVLADSLRVETRSIWTLEYPAYNVEVGAEANIDLRIPFSTVGNDSTGTYLQCNINIDYFGEF